MEFMPAFRWIGKSVCWNDLGTNSTILLLEHQHISFLHLGLDLPPCTVLFKP